MSDDRHGMVCVACKKPFCACDEADFAAHHRSEADKLRAELTAIRSAFFAVGAAIAKQGCCQEDGANRCPLGCAREALMVHFLRERDKLRAAPEGD